MIPIKRLDLDVFMELLFALYHRFVDPRERFALTLHLVALDLKAPCLLTIEKSRKYRGPDPSQGCC